MFLLLMIMEGFSILVVNMGTPLFIELQDGDVALNDKGKEEDPFMVKSFPTSCTSNKDRILPQLTLTIKTLILTTKITKSPGGTVKLSHGWSKPGSSSLSQFSTLHLHLLNRHQTKLGPPS